MKNGPTGPFFISGSESVSGLGLEHQWLAGLLTGVTR